MKNYKKKETFEKTKRNKHISHELKERNDEEIRNGIIALIKFALEDGSAIAPGYNITKEEALVWLEKQKPINNKPYDISYLEVLNSLM
jgi:hypothetical protein